MPKEILNLVDEKDNLMGEVARDKAHLEGLWHQRATVFILNKQGELLIQKRAPNMSWPNLWCGSASGHILSGETYESGAKRELKEELGIECDLKLIGKIIEESKSLSGEIDKEQHKIFICHSAGPFKIQQKELSAVKFESIEKIKKMLQKNSAQFMPGFRQEFKYYLEHR